MLGAIGLLMAASAAWVVIDPERSPAALVVCLLSAYIPWSRAWHGARGTALRPPLVWAALAVVLACLAQFVAMAEPLASGRPLAARLLYLAILALLAALISVLNARTPGERVWAGLMVLLVVVFLIPWLEEAGRIRRGHGATLVQLDDPWTIFYGLLAVVGVTNYLPTRYGPAAVAVGAVLLVEYLSLTRVAWSAERRAILGEWAAWLLALSVWVAAWCGNRVVPGARFARLWLWFRDHWGVVWALRTQDRFNRTAGLLSWPLRLSWFGLEPAGEGANTGAADSSAEAEATLRGLITRFAKSESIARVVDGSRRTSGE